MNTPPRWFAGVACLCRDLQLACAAFGAFLDGSPATRWQRIVRAPDRATFDRLLCGEARVGRPRVR